MPRAVPVAWLGSPRAARIYQCQNSRDLDTNKDYDTGKERKQATKGGMGGTGKKERKKTDNPREVRVALG